MEPRFLTVAEAARYLRLNPRSVYLLAQRGGIPASRVTGKWLFPAHLLDEWIESSARGRTGASDVAAAQRGSLPAGQLAPRRERRSRARAPGRCPPGPARSAAPLQRDARARRRSPGAPRGPGGRRRVCPPGARLRRARPWRPGPGSPGPGPGRGQRVRPGARPRGLDRQSAEARGGRGSRPPGGPLREPAARVGDACLHRGGAGRGADRARRRRRVPRRGVDPLGGRRSGSSGARPTPGSRPGPWPRR